MDAVGRPGFQKITDGTDVAEIVTNADDDTDIDGSAGLVTSSILYGRIDADTVKPLRQDQTTHTLQTIDYSHHEIHGGSNFRVQAFNDSISAGSTVCITFRVPNQTKLPHWLFEWESEFWFLFE